MMVVTVHRNSGSANGHSSFFRSEVDETRLNCTFHRRVMVLQGRLPLTQATGTGGADWCQLELVGVAQAPVQAPASPSPCQDGYPIGSSAWPRLKGAMSTPHLTWTGVDRAGSVFPSNDSPLTTIFGLERDGGRRSRTRRRDGTVLGFPILYPRGTAPATGGPLHAVHCIFTPPAFLEGWRICSQAPIRTPRDSLKRRLCTVQFRLMDRFP